MNIASEIFKSYDIRGIVDTNITTQSTRAIGLALASEAISQGLSTIAVGFDGRLSGPHLAKTLTEALTESGLNVLCLGQVTTPMLYFAAHTLANGSGIMITGSHNPPQYNGFKMMLGYTTLSGDAIQSLRQRIEQDDFVALDVMGSQSQIDIQPAYFDKVVGDIHLSRPMKVVVDSGNGVAGAFAGDLYRALGCEVTELYSEVDGNFPNHHPDPAKVENLQDLMAAVASQKADVGLAFDGDGDRLGVVTQSGEIIWPDRQLMLFAADVLSRNPDAKIIFDVKSTRLLNPWIAKHGGQAIMSRTGHSLIKAKMKETGALLAGEMSGHVFFQERWFGFDDGLYAGARLLEILSQHSNASDTLNNLPDALSTPEINIAMHEEGLNHALVAKLQETATFANAQSISKIDGIRVEYADGFGLIRASNTTPVLVLRFEADNEAAIERIQADFRTILQEHIAEALPF